MECIKQVPPLISSIKTHNLTFKELPVQSIELKLTNASPAPLQRLRASERKAGRFDSLHGALGFLWQLGSETLTFEYVRLKNTNCH